MTGSFVDQRFGVRIVLLRSRASHCDKAMRTVSASVQRLRGALAVLLFGAVVASSAGNFDTENPRVGPEAVTVSASSQHPARPFIHVIDGSGVFGEADELHSNIIDPPHMGVSGRLVDSAAFPHPGTVRGAHWVKFAFDQAYRLEELWIWNFNENAGAVGDGKYSRQGFKGVTIQYSTSGGPEPAEWLTAYRGELPQSDESDRSPVDLVVDFKGAEARYVVITADPPPSHNHGAGADERCGLSEVRFLGTPVPPGEETGMKPAHPLGLHISQPYGMLSADYETPHVKWGKPLAGGPIKTLILAPLWSHRETIELSQRLEMMSRPWMSYNSVRLHAELTEIGFVPPELVRRLLTQSVAEDQDVIVVGKLDWAMLPEDDRFEILRKVSRGTGLVYVCPPGEDPELEIVFGKRVVAGAGQILRGVPWQVLPRLRNKDPNRLVRTSVYGDGRVVVLDYQQPVRRPEKKKIDIDLHCLTPAWAQVHKSANWPRGDPPAWEIGPYEYYHSLVARAVRWAAGRDAGATLRPEVPATPRAGEVIPVTAAWETRVPAASVSLAVRTLDGNEVFFERIVLSAGQDRLGLSVSPRPAGSYLLDLWLRDGEERVIEWGSFPFTVEYRNAVESIELDRRSWNAGERVTGTVDLAVPLDADATLRIELWDGYGRRIDAQTAPSAMDRVRFELGPLAPVHIMHELRTVISRGGGALVVHRHAFPVRTTFRRGDFASVIWANIQSRSSYPTYAMLKKLREEDEADVINTLPGSITAKPAETYSIETEMEMRARNCAELNLMICPYNGGVGPMSGPEDTHISPTSITDPDNAARWDRHFQTDARIYGPYGPYVWTHGDESRYSDDPDLDWHPAALARFRRMLREEYYADLAALNREWGAEYKGWDEVMPITFEEAKRTGNFPPWLTHRLSSDRIFAEAYGRLGDIIRRGDPGARTGSDGDLGLYGPNFGYDWWRLSRHTQLMQCYHSGALQAEIKRSFAAPGSGSVRGLWFGTYGGTSLDRPSTVAYMHYHPWYSLFHQMNTSWWWAMGAPGPLSGYAADLTSMPYFASRTQALREIKAGIGKILLGATRAHDGIAVHFSESSRIADALYSKQANPWYFDYEDAVGNVIRSLEDAGFQYRFVATEEIESGVLEREGLKVLFLPHSRAVSDTEAKRITDFAAGGGAVFANIVPGTLTPTGAGRPEPALSDLFADHRTGMLLGERFLHGYHRSHKSSARWELLEEGRRRMGEVMEEHAGLVPEVRIAPVEGSAPPPEIARFDAGGIEFVTLLRSYFHRDNKPYRYRLRFADQRHLYDARTGAYLGYVDACEKEMDYRAEVIARSPYAVESVEIRITRAPMAGEPLPVVLAVRASDGEVTGNHVLRMRVLRPDGSAISWYTQNVAAPAGKAMTTIPLALNEAAGGYTLEARDVMSGVVGQGTFELGAGGL